MRGREGGKRKDRSREKIIVEMERFVSYPQKKNVLLYFILA